MKIIRRRGEFDNHSYVDRRDYYSISANDQEIRYAFSEAQARTTASRAREMLAEMT